MSQLRRQLCAMARIFLAPGAGLEGIQRRQAGIGVLGPVYVPERLGHMFSILAVLPRNRWPDYIGISGRFASECAVLPARSGKPRRCASIPRLRRGVVESKANSWREPLRRGFGRSGTPQWVRGDRGSELPVAEVTIGRFPSSAPIRAATGRWRAGSRYPTAIPKCSGSCPRSRPGVERRSSNLSYTATCAPWPNSGCPDV